MKVTVHKLKNIKRKIVGYYGTFSTISSQGRFTMSGEAKTPAEAVKRCEEDVYAALERLDRSTQINRWNGKLYVVSPDANGWRTWCEQFSQTSYYTGCNRTREEAEDSIVHHMAQCDWTYDTDDAAYLLLVPERMRSDLSSYFTWQRGMKRLKLAGYDDAEARDILAGYKKEREVA